MPRCDGPVDICSAYLRSEAFSAIVAEIPARNPGRVLVRWRLGDIIAKASNFEAYEVAVSKGMKFYMRMDFHGKVYSLPPNGIIVGSANATLSGLGIAKYANEEICTLVAPNVQNNLIIDGLFEGATRVTPELFAELNRALELANSELSVSAEWPSAVMALIQKSRSPARLFVGECFWGAPRWLTEGGHTLTDEEIHDQNLLGLIGVDRVTRIGLHLAQRQFIQSAHFCWLLRAVTNAGGEAYFGGLSAALHSALLDDPLPSRKEVKQLLQNLLEWVSALALTEILIDRPNHSQRVRHKLTANKP